MYLAVAQIEAAAVAVVCQHAVFERHSSLLLRYALVVLDDVIASEPLTMAAQSLNPLGQSAALDETVIGKPAEQATPRLVSLTGVDCSKLVVIDADLSDRHFAGAHVRPAQPGSRDLQPW